MKTHWANRFIMLALSVALLKSPDQVAVADPVADLMEISSVQVGDKVLDCPPGGTVNLGPFPKNIYCTFNPVPKAPRLPLRLRYNLEGYEGTWHNGGGEMILVVRFYSETGETRELVAQKTFTVRGESTDWNGTLEDSQLTHRRETLTVPPGVARLSVVISSAGPPSSVGIYVVEDLVVSRLSTNNRKPEILLGSPFDQDFDDDLDSQTPEGWQRDGMHPSMAKIVEVGHDPKTKAFAIVDDDPLCHAEWHNTMDLAPQVAPNDNLVLEWNEMYSIGNNLNRAAHYDSLPPGEYRLKVAEVTVFGKPTGWEQTLVSLRVPVAVWERPWFWALVAATAVGASAMSVRQVARRRLQRTMSKLQQQRALEQERLRIARDIHDDLGARVTQISLLSAMAQSDSPFSEKKARAQFDRISLVARDLVSALYETVWAVNPENDNLDAMVNYLCERINELCDQAQLRCRLHIGELPKNIGISSRARHNIMLAAKEAIHNVIKHAKASQVTVHISFKDSCLAISIQDDGCGFQAQGVPPGNGLPNMKTRMTNIGGTWEIESGLGKGSTIYLRFYVETPDDYPPENPSVPDAPLSERGEYE